VPAGAPTGHWALVGDMQEPSDPSRIGPAREVDGFGECFAHSPLGALYAAENVVAAFTAASQSTVIGALAAPGAARQVAVLAAARGDNRELQQIAGGALTLIGFAFSSYSPGQADVSVAYEGPTGIQAAVPLAMVWVGDDWRFVVPPDGADLPASALSSMDGFIPWTAGS
jgi:hypothetical protein